MSFHSSEVSFGGVPNNKKRVIIITSKNFDIKFALLLKIVVAQLVIGNSKIVFLMVVLSMLTSNSWSLINTASIKIITLEKCEVKYQSQTLFEPNWGEYDMVCGTSVESVFGGPADMDSYFNDNKDQVGKLNSIVPGSNDNQNINSIYSEIRSIREHKKHDIDRLEKLYFELSNNYPDEWLAKLEIYEILYNQESECLKQLKESIYSRLNKESDLSKAIEKSILLIEK